MARHPNPAVEPADALPTLSRLSADMVQYHAAEALLAENTKLLAVQLRYDGSLHPDALEDGIRDSQTLVNLELFKIGARLLLLKEQCAHGEFMQRCERLDIAPRAAQKIMQVSLKFSNAPSTAHLQKLGKTKLIELLALDDEEVKELSSEGSVRGIELDSIDRMSCSELRKQLRDAKAQAEGTQKLLSEKNTKLDELHTALNADKAKKRPSLQSPSQELQALLGEVGALTDSIASTLIADFNRLFVRICDHHAIHGGTSMDVMTGFLSRIAGEVEELRGLFALRTTPLDAMAERALWDTDDEPVSAPQGDAHLQADLLSAGEE